MARIGKTAALLFCFVFFLSMSAQSAVNVTAFADRKEMGLGDTIQVTVAVSSSESVQASEPKFPELRDFDLMNSTTSSATSSRMIGTPGGMKFETERRIEFNYLLAAKREGVMTIPPFEVAVEGKIYKTEPFQIRVSKMGSGAARPQPGQDEMDEAEEMFNQLLQNRGQQIPKSQVVPKNPNEAFFIYLDLDKKEVYEGEQITAQWYLFSKGNLLSLDRLKFPDLKGFWKEIIEEVPSLNFTQEIINGVAYRKALLASHALFPIKPGESVIDEYKVKATVQLPVSQFGVFGFGQPYTFSRASERVKIKVKPLPLEGRPQDFSGAVGLFEVQASVDHNEVPINQPVSLKLRFDGEGNAKLIELPPLNLPAGVENYDTKSDAKFFKNGRSFKEFEVLLIPREPGEVTIPAISVSAFDPKSGKYYTKRAEPIVLKVSGQKTNETTTPAVSGGNQPEPSKTASESGPPALMMTYEANSSMGRMAWPLFLFSILVSVVGLGWKARVELGHREKKQSVYQLLQNRMKSVHKTLNSGDWRGASAQMTNAIYSVLGAVATDSGGADREIMQLLDKAPPSLRRDLGVEIQATVDLFQMLSFAPEEAIGAKKENQNLKAEIQKAEKLLKKAIEHMDQAT